MKLANEPLEDRNSGSFEQICGTPLWFGRQDCPLFGWIHSPTDHRRTTAVIICAPFGHEYMVCHRSIRKLASQLATKGYPTIRFDYQGSGDSSGRNDDPGRLSSWMSSIRDAIDLARRATNCSRIVLVGIRLGATLATLTACNIDIDGLVLIAPVVSGRKYVRELIAFGGLKQAPQDSTGHAGVDEVVGYPLSSETKHDLSQIDLSHAKLRQTSQALIFKRDDIPGDESKLAKSLQSCNVAVEALEAPGYKGMMTDDAFDSIVPDLLWHETAQWLCNHFPEQEHYCEVDFQIISETKFVERQIDIRERIIIIQGTTAILTTKADGNNPHLPIVIISNTGANHRVGNHRLCVSMARKWAAQGFRVVRYDRPGTGDSKPTPGGRENDIYAPSGVSCLRHLMDFLGAHEPDTKFTLAGLCSGAYFSYQTALIDSRVTGLLMINPLTYHWRDGDSVARPTPRTIYKSTDFYLNSVIRSDTWKRLLRGEIDLRGIVGTLGDRARYKTASKWRTGLAWALRHEPSISDVGRNFLSLEKRGVDILMVFDAAEGGIDLMEEHLLKGASLMRRRPLFKLEIINHADHTFTPLWAQAHLVKIVCDHWLQKHNKAPL